MRTLDIKVGEHDWEKQNLITQIKKGRFCDTYKCRKCGVVVKSYRLGEIEVSERNYKKTLVCKKVCKSEFVKIIRCNAFGDQFLMLTPGSIHAVIPAPEGQKSDRGVWVMGKTEPVLLLFGEFKYQNDSQL